MDIEYFKKEILSLNPRKYKPDRPPKIATTAEYCEPNQAFDYNENVVIEMFSGLYFVILGTFCFGVAIITEIILKKPYYAFLTFIGLSVVSFILYKNIQAFHTKIIVDNNGIIVKWERFAWKDIFQTFILTEPYGGVSNLYPSTFFLVIVDNKKTILKFDISYIGTSQKKFAGMIEYFKNRSGKISD